MKSSEPIRVLVLTAGGTGRELYDLLSFDNRIQAEGFLDDHSKDERVLGLINDWKKFNTHRFISALGSYKKMAERKQVLSAIPLECFIGYCSPKALIYPSAKICTNSTVVFPFSIISANAELSAHTFIYHHVTISHDVIIASDTIVSNHATVSGNVSIGRCCYIGANSTIKEGVKIGNQCIIASGASVIHNVPDGYIYIRPDHMIKNEYYDDSNY